jgi:hypothetical protein
MTRSICGSGVKSAAADAVASDATDAMERSVVADNALRDPLIIAP